MFGDSLISGDFLKYLLLWLAVVGGLSLLSLRAAASKHNDKTEQR